MKILIIGTSVIDLFLSVDQAHYKTNGASVTFNLGDKAPVSTGGLLVGGNGANVSVGLKRLGFEAQLYTYLGNDGLAEEIRKNLLHNGVTVIQGRPKIEKTPLHLIFNFEHDRIIFSDYPLEDYEFAIGQHPPKYDYIYLTSIGEKWQSAYKQALEFADNNNIPIALSPGSRQLDDGGQALLRAIRSCAILLINKDEAMQILGFFHHKTQSIPKMFSLLHKLGPEIVSITDGEAGAWASDKNKVYKIVPFNDKKPVIQKVGAGDAYASAFFAAVLQKKPLDECMRWGAINAHGVMGHLGAQTGLLSISDLQRLISVNPSFKATLV